MISRTLPDGTVVKRWATKRFPSPVMPWPASMLVMSRCLNLDDAFGYHFQTVMEASLELWAQYPELVHEIADKAVMDELDEIENACPVLMTTPLTD